MCTDTVPSNRLAFMRRKLLELPQKAEVFTYLASVYGDWVMAEKVPSPLPGGKGVCGR